MTGMKYTAGIIAVISMFVLPAAAVAQQLTQDQVVAQLQAQTQALLQQIAQLEAQAGINRSGGTSNLTSGGTGVGAYGKQGGLIDSSACPNIGRPLKRGMSGDDIRRLQQFLAQDVTVYPEGIVTGYYGALTEVAVKRWQVKYNIVSGGTPSTTGYGVVGPRTAAAIALLCSTRGPGGGSTSSPVGGFIQVSPIAGPAPLTVSVMATVNTTNSCNAAVYALNFGDGTQSVQIAVPSGACTQVVQTIPHTYQYGGTYQIVLAAGSHRTTATVVVSGNPQPPASISFSASPLSGPAPLTVTFSNTVSGAVQGAFQINYGDGSSVDQMAPGGQTTHIYRTAGTYTAQLVNSVSGVVGSASVAVGTGVASSSYGIISVTPLGTTADGAGITAQFVVPPCAAYQISWGDGTPVSTTNASCTPTGPDGVVFNASHNYATSGSYTIGLKDGSGNTKASAGVSVTL